MVETTGAEAVEENGQAVLMSRVKELEQLVKKQDQKIGELSQERRKQMEEIVDTSIANWLNRLPNLSEATKASFKQGVDKLAKVSFGLCCLPFYYFYIEILIFYWNMQQEANITNSAWEVICCASEAHKQNANELESMRLQLEAKEAKLVELSAKLPPSFTAESSRMLSPTGTNTRKRQREEDPEPTTTHSAWDDFAALVRADHAVS
jgi:uncharacterized protein YggL (DUF469 family)